MRCHSTMEASSDHRRLARAYRLRDEYKVIIKVDKQYLSSILVVRKINTV
jgi:hypothetical protein